MNDSDRVFTGSVAEIYERCMVPMLFEPYAADLVSRLRGADRGRILEVGAGTGVLTRAMAASLADDVTIVASDLNPGMLDRAAAAGAGRVEWRRADVMELPFPDGGFDTVVCQFAAMFFPDKPRAFAEVRRVLAPGGRFLFNVWDAIGVNEFADEVDRAVAVLFPADPPRFMMRTPHGYHDTAAIARHLREAGFANAPEIEAVEGRSRAPSARSAAMGFCQGTPLRLEIEARDADRLEDATSAGAAALAARFGPGPIDGRMRAYVIAVDAR